MLVKKVLIDRTDRLYQMPPDVLDFARPLLGKPLLSGMEMIDLGSFDWPVPFEHDPKPAMAPLKAASPEKIAKLKESLADWLAEYHGTRHISRREIFLGNGISSLVWLTALTFVDTGDLALVPALGVPLYRKAVTAVGGIPVPYPLSSRHQWLPDLEKMSSRVGKVARVLFLNSPHNPTGAELDEQTLHALVEMASRENTLLVNDACYQSIPTRKPLSLHSVDGGRKVGLELYSFAYLLGLPPIPFGFAVGHRHLIASLEAAGGVFPPYIPEAFIDLAVQGLRSFPSKSIQDTRRQITSAAAASQSLLEHLGLERTSSAAIPFLWTRIPRRRNSVTFARQLLKRYHLLVAPGTEFGDIGQGYIRLSLTAPLEKYAEAVRRVSGRRTLTRPKGRE
jgi:LL-diaminopimelate aminotransferase